MALEISLSLKSVTTLQFSIDLCRSLCSIARPIIFSSPSRHRRTVSRNAPDATAHHSSSSSQRQQPSLAIFITISIFLAAAAASAFVSPSLPLPSPKPKQISVEDERDRQNRLAKMRSLLFSHEIKAKRIKKIKSKTFHRQLKKNRLKSASSEVQMYPEAANEYAKKQEFKRAKERMTLKHKNSSKWAKRFLKCGLSVQDEGTRAAFSEQNHQGAVLTRKIESMKNDSSDDSSDEDEDDGSVDGEDSAMLLMRAKEKTLKVIEEEDEMPKKGVLSVPFMVE